MKRRSGGSVAKALAELVLIVAGVLIALFVDEWRDGRADREREAALLVAVQANLAADSVFIATYERRIPEINAALRRMWELDPDDLPPDPTLDSLLLETSRYIPDLWTTTTFKGIEQTGDLRLIRDSALVSALGRYYTELIPRALGQNAIERNLNFEFAVNQGWGAMGWSVPAVMSVRCSRPRVPSPSSLSVGPNSATGSVIGVAISRRERPPFVSWVEGPDLKLGLGGTRICHTMLSYVR